MNYKVIFSRNNVMICKPTDMELPKNNVGNTHHVLDQKTNNLIYAIIKADSFEQANNEAQKLVRQIKNLN